MCDTGRVVLVDARARTRVSGLPHVEDVAISLIQVLLRASSEALILNFRKNVGAGDVVSGSILVGADTSAGERECDAKERVGKKDRSLSSAEETRLLNSCKEKAGIRGLVAEASVSSVLCPNPKDMI